MIIFTAKFNESVKNGPPGLQTPTTETRSWNKSTGKLIYPKTDDSDKHLQSQVLSQGQFHTLRIDRQNGIIDLISHQMRLRHYVGTNATAGLDKAPPSTPTFWDMQQPRPVVGPLQPVRPRLGGQNP
jgi:hypothetical protein